ncbi:MAG: class I SAM-dependent methyltransferase [Methylococcales bacterium]|nr:class I SAM-dependent methyltransferase [Methylococcales bacterium]
MKRISLLETAHAMVGGCLWAGGVAIDATVGNGHDTLFLAGCVGEQGRVFGFDIQARAVASTRQRLLAEGVAQRVSLFHCSHALMTECLPAEAGGRVGAAMFNLGYLPGGDKTLVTHAGATLAALDAAGGLLAAGGVMTVLAYPGHIGGAAEAGAVADWCREQALRRRFAVELIESAYPQPAAPRLFVIRKQS